MDSQPPRKVYGQVIMNYIPKTAPLQKTMNTEYKIHQLKHYLKEQEEKKHLQKMYDLRRPYRKGILYAPDYTDADSCELKTVRYSMLRKMKETENPVL